MCVWKINLYLQNRDIYRKRFHRWIIYYIPTQQKFAIHSSQPARQKIKEKCSTTAFKICAPFYTRAQIYRFKTNMANGNRLIGCSDNAVDVKLISHADSYRENYFSANGERYIINCKSQLSRHCSAFRIPWQENKYG